MQRRRVSSITLLAPPPIALFHDLLVAPFSRTSRVTERLVLDKVDGGPRRKVLGLVRRADVVVLDLPDRLDLVRSDRLRATSSASHTRVRIGLVLHAHSLGIEPGTSLGLST
jgi:hypothetical protein